MSTPLRFFKSAIACLLLAGAGAASAAETPEVWPFFAFDNGVGRGVWPPSEQAETVKSLGYDGIHYNYTNPKDFATKLAACNAAKHSDNQEGVEGTAEIETLLAQAREIITRMIYAGKFREASWVTGRHFMDDGYMVGEYVTRNSAGEWTDHPSYSGVNSDERPDDMDILKWVLWNLPKSGIVTVTGGAL